MVDPTWPEPQKFLTQTHHYCGARFPLPNPAGHVSPLFLTLGGMFTPSRQTVIGRTDIRRNVR